MARIKHNILHLLLFSFFPFGLFAENFQIVQIEPSWNIFNNYYTQDTKTTSYYDYNTYFQSHIIEILQSMEIKAIPALYTSAFQTVYDPRSVQELNDLLKYEIPEQKKYLTLVPVVKNSTIESTFYDYSIKLSVSIYVQEDNGKLGKELFSADIECNGKCQSNPINAADFEKRLNSVKEKLSSQKQWQKIKDYIKEHGDRFHQFPSFNKSAFFKEQTTHYFAQSDGLYFNNHPEAGNETSLRIHKSNSLIITADENTDKLLFNFDLANEIPSVIYAYIIKPDYKIIQVQDSDIHIEKSPDALPNDTYNSKRYLVINLPGLTSSSVVCYAIKYLDRGYYDSTYFNQLKKTGYRYPLARDFSINYSSDSTPWQVRTWMPNKSLYSKISAQANNITISESLLVLLGQFSNSKPNMPGFYSSKKRPYSLFGKNFNNVSPSANPILLSDKNYTFQLNIFQGLPKPVPIPTVEPFTYLEPPTIRVSTVSTWDSLYSETRDSIFSILSHRNKSNYILTDAFKKTASIDSCFFALQNYMIDSLRYIHISFNAHKTIPVSPDSIIKTKMGDCKDYSTLFISELNSLGIDAFPALVNTTWPNALAITLPSYNTFNHMIVYVPKYQWWIDPLYTPLPPDIVPQYLTGLKSLVLYKDSIRMVDIRDNPDSTCFNSIRYEIEINGSKISCKYIDLPSIEKSSYIRKHLSKTDSTRYFDFLFSSEKYFKKNSTVELDLSFTGLDNNNDQLTIFRQFEVNNAIIAIGGSKLLNLPEMPLFPFVSIVSANSRHSDLYLPTDLICDVAIKIKGGYKVKWPIAHKNGVFGSFLTISTISNDEILFSFHVKKGLIPLNEYGKFKLALDSFRNFFSNPIPIQKIIKKQ